MAKIIPFPANKKSDSKRQLHEKLVGISKQIDELIVHSLNEQNVDARELAGVLAHRLGNLIKHLDGKSRLWQIYEKVMKKQANIGES